MGDAGAGAWDRIFRRLSRVTSSSRYMAEIDALRFIAIGSVFLFHVNGMVQYGGTRADGWVARVLAQGHYGVQLFFVISGFVLGLPFALQYLNQGRAVDLGKYFRRRLTRLEPPFLVNIGLCMLAIMLLSRHSVSWAHLLATALYAHTLVYHTQSPINTVTWSLEVEVQFYMLAPVLARVFAIRARVVRRAVMAGVAIAAVLAQHACLTPDSFLRATLLGSIQYFVLGFLIVDWYLLDWPERPARRSWDAVSLLGWPLLLLVLIDDRLAWLVFPWAICLLCVAFFRGVLLRRFLTARLVTCLGGMCYTIYLVHFKIVWWLGPWLQHRLLASASYGWCLLGQCLLTGVAVLACSVLFFLLIEKPCMYPDWPERLARTVRSIPVPLPVRSADPGN